MPTTIFDKQYNGRIRKGEQLEKKRKANENPEIE